MNSLSLELQNGVSHAIADTCAAGALVYGSQVWNSGVGSPTDIDLICCSAIVGPPKRILLYQNGREIDVFLGSTRHLETRIRKMNRHNDNFLLYACAEGVLAIDHDGGLGRIVEQARGIWARGPSMPKNAERQKMHYSIQKYQSTAASLIDKATKNPEAQALAALECNQIFVNCMYMYCRLELLWAAPIWFLIRWKNARYHELQQLCGAYLAAQDVRDRALLIESISVILSRKLWAIKSAHAGRFESVWAENA